MLGWGNEEQGHHWSHSRKGPSSLIVRVQLSNFSCARATTVPFRITDSTVTSNVAFIEEQNVFLKNRADFNSFLLFFFSFASFNIKRKMCSWEQSIIHWWMLLPVLLLYGVARVVFVCFLLVFTTLSGIICCCCFATAFCKCCIHYKVP